MLRLRSWRRQDTIGAQRLARELWPAGPHPGGVGWEAATDQLPRRTVVAVRGRRTVGWAGFSPGVITVHGAPVDAAAGGRLLEWALGAAGTGELRIPVAHGDDALPALVAEAGFEPEDADPVRGMVRAAAGDGPRWPRGYRVRAAGRGEEAERVAVHRAAWRPADMPWAPHVLDRVDPSATSGFTRDHLARVRRALLFDPDLDLVVEAPDGSLAACATVWWDPRGGCAELEPVGVVPAHRRRGLAAALARHACAEVARRGGREVFINARPMDEYPAPAAAYLSAGFTLVERGRHHVRKPLNT
ncbi:acetyltransferase (GNAT) family protein [Nocardiopsis sp. Huas11]|uniref:GNAT family N-acetyltransferase n=1 Tax=Nocardiopsis sp. Huas11 TaxID=2183912 RepID=UPI000EAD8AA1|nr:GNAT family N-acetyltransferase [Nocardiopsis sp. Huas11]RKS09153.1 acetyltransferase (GNAT) family protein [Nocardiopsis sp. Huas11]